VNIEQFIVNQHEKSLTITFSRGKSFALSFEYLRVSSPREMDAPKKPITAHKKLVELLNIEVVGKHGHRLVFDDGHDAIYASEYLTILAKEMTPRWQEYLTKLADSGQSREAMINFKQL